MPIKDKKWRNVSIIMIGFTILVLLFEIIPRLFSTGKLVTQWLGQKNQIEKANEYDISIRTYSAYNNKLKKQISYFVSDYEENQNISSVLNLIDEISSKSEVKVESIKPGKIVKQNNLWLQPMDIYISGKYEGFYNFLRFIESAEKVIIPKEVIITNDDSNSGKLKVKIKLNVYLNL